MSQLKAQCTYNGSAQQPSAGKSSLLSCAMATACDNAIVWLARETVAHLYQDNANLGTFRPQISASVNTLWSMWSILVLREFQDYILFLFTYIRVKYVNVKYVNLN